MGTHKTFFMCLFDLGRSSHFLPSPTNKQTTGSATSFSRTGSRKEEAETVQRMGTTTEAAAEAAAGLALAQCKLKKFNN